MCFSATSLMGRHVWLLCSSESTQSAHTSCLSSQQNRMNFSLWTLHSSSKRFLWSKKPWHKFLRARLGRGRLVDTLPHSGHSLDPLVLQWFSTQFLQPLWPQGSITGSSKTLLQTWHIKSASTKSRLVAISCKHKSNNVLTSELVLERRLSVRKMSLSCAATRRYLWRHKLGGTCKGLVYLRNENSVFVYTPCCLFKPVVFFLLQNTRDAILKNEICNQKPLLLDQKYHLLCSPEERKSYRFEMTRGYVDNDRIFILKVN